jgi:hypothetical protein
MTEKTQEQQKVAFAVGGKEERPSIRQMGGTYFYSSSIAGNKNVFVTPQYMDLLTNAFKMAEIKHDVKNIAYSVMPNHFLWVFKLRDDKDDPVAVYKEVKKNVALGILQNLIEESKDETNHYEIFDLFQNNERVVRSNPRKIIWAFKQKAKELNKGGRYKIFEPKSKLFLLKDEENLMRNIKFIYDSPVRERWQLVEKSEDYPYLFVSEDYLNKIS